MQVELADKLPHVQSLCVHEMIVRAYKHILQAVIAAVDDAADLAGAIAACLNVLLGTPSSANADTESANDDKLKWKWVENFLLKRFGWLWKHESCEDLKKFPILRGLSHKVLLLDNFSSSLPSNVDISLSLFPPHRLSNLTGRT